ncbi:MAG: hypothetical protein LBO70_05575 [Clostridiales Family XIII bacterium]|jgi:hypothetical protein|nr:hypothetical protein [Clostridiales Family XIII bacterium]
MYDDKQGNQYQGGPYSHQNPPYGNPYTQQPSENGPYQQQSPPPGGPYYRQPSPQGYYVQPEIPPEVRRWNWGAFMLNWIWGCGNGAYLTLLCLIPVFNIVWVFVCGARGNVWAWKSGKFKDLGTFLTTQRTWNIAGIICFCIFIVYLLIVIVTISMGVAMMLPWDGIMNGTEYAEYS